MYFKAAILTGKKKIRIEDITFKSINHGQVLVKNIYAGICGTQLLEFEGKKGKDKFYPHCFGHEALSKVIKIGPGVKKVKKNDLVIASWIQGRGIAAKPPKYYNKKGEIINSGPISVFSEYSIISENRLYRKPRKVEKKFAAVFGCALPTGIGSLISYIDYSSIKNICIIGFGGVGLFSYLASKFCKINNIVVIDNDKSKLNKAKKMGAKIFLNKNKKIDPEKIKELNNNNLFDVIIEATGNSKVIEQATLLLNHHGSLIINGNVPFGERIKINPIIFNQGKKIFGSFGGGSNIDTEMATYIKIFKLIPQKIKKENFKFFKLRQISYIFNNFSKMKIIRPIIKF